MNFFLRNWYFASFGVCQEGGGNKGYMLKKLDFHDYMRISEIIGDEEIVYSALFSLKKSGENKNKQRENSKRARKKTSK